MPVPVQVFLLCFTVVMVSLPIYAVRAYRSGLLDDRFLILSWAPLATWLITPLIVLMSGRTPPSRSTSALVGVILLAGVAAAVAMARSKGAPRATRNAAWACAIALMLRAGFAAVAAFRLLQP